MTDICRHCGSPATGRPCWYYIRHPEAATSGGDPPCISYRYGHKHDRRHREDLLIIGASGGVLAAAVFASISARSLADLIGLGWAIVVGYGAWLLFAGLVFYAARRLRKRNRKS